jgi:hypothetical protein
MNLLVCYTDICTFVLRFSPSLSVFNFTVPFLSFLAIFILCVVAVVLYVIPLRALIFVWGVHKFTKKLLRPHALDNNELIDFLDRIPDAEQLVIFSPEYIYTE